jgi:hypothetical protein
MKLIAEKVHLQLQEIYNNNPENGYLIIEITLLISMDSTLIQDLALQGNMAEEGYEFLRHHLQEKKVRFSLL